MYAANVMGECSRIVGSRAAVALIVTAFFIMVGLVKPADAVKNCVAIAGIAIVVLALVSVFVGMWSSMPWWQKAIASLIGFAAWRLRRGRGQPRRKKEEE